MEQRHRPRWREFAPLKDTLVVIASALIVLGVVGLVLAYAVPPLRGAALPQILGGALLAAGLSALVGTLTGREAVRQQSAKEVNLDRKRKTYGPLYAELKALRIAFSNAENGNAPAPWWVDTGDEVERADVVFFPEHTTVPTLRCWPEFRRDYRDRDFKSATQALLDNVQACATTYNNKVEAARVLAISILASHVDRAINDLQQATAYKRELEKQAEPKSASALLSDEPKKHWYGYINYIVTSASSRPDTTPGQHLANLWLGRWPSQSPSQLLGWILAKPTDQQHRAADYVSSGYPAKDMMYFPPPNDWIYAIFEAAWLPLRTAPEVKKAMAAGTTLFERVQEAEKRLDDGLRDIQERYEGGEPLV